MTVAQTAQTSASATPKEMGLLSRMIAKAWPTMTPTERTELVASAAADSDTALAKATTLLGTEIDQVEDLWDGPPDDRLATKRTGGPGSEVSSGRVGIGPRQAASGDGALVMERRYSDHAPQSGVEEATNRLGRELAKAMTIIKSLIQVNEAASQRIQLLETAVMSAKAIGPAEIEAAVAKAVASAVPGIVTTMAKAMKDEGPEGAEDDEDEDMAKAIAKASESDDVEDDRKEHGDDKEAAKARVVVKGLLKLIRQTIAKAEEAADEKAKDKFEEHIKKAKTRLAKARTQLAIAKAISGSGAAAAVEALDKSAASVAKAIRSQAENQVKWPESDARRVGETAKATEASPDLAKAVDQITKAASGMGVMTASFQEVMGALMSSKSPDSGDLPPVFMLAKAMENPRGADAAQAKLMQMVDTNVISIEDFDRATDILGRARRGMDVTPMIDILPEAAQQVLRPQAAA